MSDMTDPILASQHQRAAQAISEAGALLITAGAGMGVDSGMPDFRGPEGFWRAYPAYRALGLRFEEMANPKWFGKDPELAWGFYGHRMTLYRATQPHAGFGILARWAAARRAGWAGGPRRSVAMPSRDLPAGRPPGPPSLFTVSCMGRAWVVRCLGPRTEHRVDCVHRVVHKL